jgi:hypothetical protein
MEKPSPHASTDEGGLALDCTSWRSHYGRVSNHILLIVIVALWLCAAAAFNIRSRRNRPEAKQWWIAANVLTVPGIVLLLLFGMGIFNLWFAFLGMALLLTAGVCRLVYNSKLRKLGLPQREPTLERRRW